MGSAHSTKSESALAFRSRLTRYAFLCVCTIMLAAGCRDRDDGGDETPPDPPDPLPIASCDDIFAEPFAWPAGERDIQVEQGASWKERVSPSDPFVVAPPEGMESQASWVKFTVLVEDPSRVFFQDSVAYPFHYDFAASHLTPFMGASRAEYDRASLHEDGQQAILGAVLFPPKKDGEPVAREIGVQLVRQDPYHPAMVARLVELVVASLDLEPETSVFYFPTFEQEASVALCGDWYADLGIVIGNSGRWLDGDDCYSHGWALGRLVQVDPDRLAETYRFGGLLPTDILLTTSVPAEVPFVAGIISLSPATPNSHVALLADSREVPFVHVRLDETIDRLTSLRGRQILLVAERSMGGTCFVRVVDVEGVFDEETYQAILALKQPAPIEYSPKQRLGSFHGSVDGLGPADIVHFGGKAAHFGLLRDVVPESSREAIAFSFDLWDEFLSQPVAPGRSLAEEIDSRLSAYSWPPEDMSALSDTLAEIRSLVRNSSFTEGQRQSVLAALEGFDPIRRIRARSSTNVEDTESFTGAGLYDSYSGCLADDLAPGTDGPSACNPDRPKRRGVFRALARVYASFWNDNAYLERLRRGVDEDEVGMAVLVHYSFPDELELANGVATLQNRGYQVRTMMVTQKNAVSVTNPSSAAVPEVVELLHSVSGTQLRIQQYSSLVPLGATVLEWDQEYRDYQNLFLSVTERYSTATGRGAPLWLDFEYKKSVPEGLMLTQVRPLPVPSTVPSVKTFLMDGGERLCVFQGEYGDVFANHRAKLVFAMPARAMELSEENIRDGLAREGSLRFYGGGSVVDYEGAVTGLPDGAWGIDGVLVTASWVADDDGDKTRWELAFDVPRLVRPRECPVLTFRDLHAAGRLEHERDETTYDWDGNLTHTRSDRFRLVTCHDGPDPSGSVEREVGVEIAPGISVIARFLHPPGPQGMSAGYTAPLLRWEDVVISGLSSEPIVLTSPWAMTYRPEHHNFDENFLFEPLLDSGLTAAERSELESRDVRKIFVRTGDSQRIVAFEGFDGEWRDAP